VENQSAETKEPIEAKEISITLTVGQVNHLLTLLGELPYHKSANAISIIKTKGDEQLTKLLNEENN